MGEPHEAPTAPSEPPGPEEAGIDEIEAELCKMNRSLDGLIRLAARRPPPFRDPAPSAPPG
ncbi:hypothetical protein [Sorangium sp. So ce388]|uniref:hypothetical protein n=1 Tax=Sorangium sp. So ce388 TaxID=3133309 RepID=UPI003F5C0578